MSKKSELAVEVSDRDHVLGAPSALTTLVEYGDFDCPYCQAAAPVVPKLLKHFAGALRFVFRHNPLGDLHPHARIAAQAAEAAALQGKFWPMHERLFAHPHALDEASLVAHAAAIGLDAARFAADLHSHALLQRIREDEAGGLRSGVVGTPTFFINGVHFRDKPDYDTLLQAITALHAAPHKHEKHVEIQRRDGSGHLDPSYRAKLLAESGSSHEVGDDRAFINTAHSRDALAEGLGEEFVETATSGQDEGEEIQDQIVTEESGGPFVETDGGTEFAHGTDASNIKGATREPFPKT